MKPASFLLVAAVLAFTASAQAQSPQPIDFLNANMRPERALVDDYDALGHHRVLAVSEVREYPDDGRACEPGWDFVFRSAGTLVCGKPIR